MYAGAPAHEACISDPGQRKNLRVAAAASFMYTRKRLSHSVALCLSLYKQQRDASNNLCTGDSVGA